MVLREAGACVTLNRISSRPFPPCSASRTFLSKDQRLHAIAKQICLSLRIGEKSMLTGDLLQLGSCLNRASCEKAAGYFTSTNRSIGPPCFYVIIRGAYAEPELALFLAASNVYSHGLRMENRGRLISSNKDVHLSVLIGFSHYQSGDKLGKERSSSIKILHENRSHHIG